jgi:hypothetical protein
MNHRDRMRGRRLYLFASGCVEAAESCDHGNEPSTFIKCGEFVDKARSFLRRTLPHWDYLFI